MNTKSIVLKKLKPCLAVAALILGLLFLTACDPRRAELGYYPAVGAKVGGEKGRGYSHRHYGHYGGNPSGRNIYSAEHYEFDRYARQYRYQHYEDGY